MVLATGSKVMDLPGIGPIGAARILADVGDVTRFADRNRFASWTGTAPWTRPPGSRSVTGSPERATERSTTCCTWRPLTQIRLDTEGRAYYLRKRAAGKTHLEALRCLKRRISDAVYRQLLADARIATPEDPTDEGEASPGGQCGASLISSAVDLPPHIDTSDQPLPGPAEPTLQPRRRPRKKPALTATC